MLLIFLEKFFSWVLRLFVGSNLYGVELTDQKNETRLSRHDRDCWHSPKWSHSSHPQHERRSRPWSLSRRPRNLWPSSKQRSKSVCTSGEEHLCWVASSCAFQAQLEFYFSAQNLAQDKFLKDKVSILFCVAPLCISRRWTQIDMCLSTWLLPFQKWKGSPLVGSFPC